MNFTRDPIIETIISAKDGYKLSIKSSKGLDGEEYLVDAVEVVSFGGSFFYRCQERPKIFFIPANDFEILEVKETRILIKNPNIDRNIKIAGGKDTSKTQKSEDSSSQQDQKRDKKKGRRSKPKSPEQTPIDKTSPVEAKSATQTEEKKPTVFSHLLTPPPGLISESLLKYKQLEEKTKASEAPETLTLEDQKEETNIKSKPVGKKVKPKEATLVKEEPDAKKVLKPESKQEKSPENEIAPPVVEKALDDSTASEPPKAGEMLQEKEINAEPFVKVPPEDETK